MAVNAVDILFLQIGFLRPIHEKKDSFFRAVMHQTANGNNDNNRTCAIAPTSSFNISSSPKRTNYPRGRLIAQYFGKEQTTPEVQAAPRTNYPRGRGRGRSAESNDLIFRINNRINPKGYNASRHRVPDVNVKHNRKLRAVNDVYK